MVDAQLAARHKAMDLLARREHTRKELADKLTSRGFETQIVNTVIDRLTDEGLQSDARFTEAFVSMRSKKGQGPLRILKELQERGIDQRLQEEFVDSKDEQWLVLIRQVRSKKFGKTIPEDYQQRMKQARFLQYRGFTSEQIHYEIRDSD